MRQGVLAWALVVVGLLATAQGQNTKLKTIYWMFSCHLDVGFNAHTTPPSGLAIDVINEYFTQFYPKAIQTSTLLAQQGFKYVFTTHPWLVDLYVHCAAIAPQFPGKLLCPSGQQLAAFTAAIKQGWITWHAFPFNAEPEMYEQHLFKSALNVARRLDIEFGKNQTITMSQRDVPGMTRGVVPLLLMADLEAITVGVNEASSPPVVPSVFRWENLIAIYHPSGYGGLEVSDVMTFPGSTIGLIADFRGDNAGPHSPDEVLDHLKTLKKNFPNAQFITGTYDDFVKAILPYKHQLVEVTDEIGDTWIHGVSTDPWKSQAYREISRLRAVYCKTTQCSDVMNPTAQVDQRLLNFDLLLMKIGEHTWGLDVKTFLNDTTNWKNTDFQANLNKPNYQLMIRSWLEQRAYIDNAISALGTLPLAATIKYALSALRVSAPPDLSNYTPVSNWAQQTFTFGQWQMRFGPSGGIEYLFDTRTRAQFASSSNIIGNYVYQTLDQNDFTTYLNTYGNCDYIHGACPWFGLDFGKPGVQIANPKSALWFPQVVQLYRSNANNNQTGSFIMQLKMQDTTAVTYYGAPSAIWVTFAVGRNPDVPRGLPLSVQVDVLGKTATRLPEASWVSFNPIKFKETNVWSILKVEERVGTDQISQNGSTHLHVSSESKSPIRLQGDTGVIELESLDAPLLSVGAFTPMPLPLDQMPSQDSGIQVCLHNNLWGTNYPMWYPFVSGDENMRFRFNMFLFN